MPVEHQPRRMPLIVVSLLVVGASLLGWTWPVGSQPDQPRVLAEFAPPARDWLPGHRGVDLEARPGTPVRAAGSGVVVHAGPVADRGVVSLEHPGGVRTTYEPVLAEVSRGQVVRAGQVIGTVGRWSGRHPSCPEGGCLHWGARRGRVYIDPRWLVDPPPVRLLPGPPVPSGTRVGLAVGGAEPVDRYVRVPLRGGDGGVPQQLLHRAQVRAPLE